MAKSRKRQLRRPEASPAGAEAAARAPELLALDDAADPLDRLSELAESTPGGAPALVEALGAMRSDDAGRVLAAVAIRAPDKELRKAARRGLHRLRAAGVAVGDVAILPDAPVPPPPAVAGPTDAYTTAADGIGTRVVWLNVDRPLGGLLEFALALNDLVGMKDCSFRETTRKKFNQTLEGWRERQEMHVVDLPPDYALALVSEALALNAEQRFPVPTEFQLHRHVLGELPPPPEDALIHRHVSRGQALLLPNLLEESAGLLDEEELKGWFFGYDESIGRAQELQRLRESRIILSGEPREERERRVVDAAIDALFTPEQRRAIRRRLEEVAWVFWQTGRERAARQAVAAAFGLSQGSLTRHPFVRALVEKSLELALEAARAGIDPARLRRSPRDPIATP